MPNLLERKMLKDRIVQNISKAVKLIQASQLNNEQNHRVCSNGPPSSSLSSSSTAALSNEDPAFCRLMEHLDHALLHGLRHVTAGYWVLVCEFTHKATLQQIRQLGNVTTNLGRGRAWLYLALTDHLLESYLRCFMDNPKLLKKYYVKEALVQDDMRMQILLTLAAGMEYVNFQLDVDCAYLDLSSYPRHVRRASQAEDDPEVTSMCSMNSSVISQGSASTPEQAVDVANLSDVSESIEDGSLPLRRSSSNLRQSPLVTVESEQQRLERISQLPAPRPTDIDSVDGGGGNNGLEVIRVKVKSRRAVKKRRGKKETDADSVSVTELDSPASQESGYRSVPEESSPKGRSNTDRLSIASIPEGSCESKEQGKGKDSVVVGELNSKKSESELNMTVENDLDSQNKPQAANQSKSSQSTNQKACNKESASQKACHKESTNQKDCNKESTNQKACNNEEPTNQNLASGSKMEEEEEVHNLQQNVVFSVTMDSDIKWNSAKEKSPEKEQKQILSIYDGLPVIDDKLKDEKTDSGKSTVQQESPAKSVSAEILNESVKSQEVPSRSSSISASSKGSSSNSLASDASLNAPSSSKAKSSSEDFFVRVDNNLKLVLMLEILQGDDEHITQLYHTSVGHTEGEATPIQLLITDGALYVLVPGVESRYRKDAIVNHRELDYVSLSLNQQVINIVCTNRRKQLWITTGNARLTSAIISDLSAAYAACESGRLGQLSVLDDATTQRIALRKWAASECPSEGSGVQIQHYSLVHWEDRQPGASEVNVGPSHEGKLMVKTSASLFGLAGGGWVPGYFVLKDGALMQYTSKHDASPPQLVIQLNCEQCGGCRRARTTEREHAFEVVLTDGEPLLLCAATEKIAMQWLQALCQAVSQGMGVRLPNSGVVSCVSVLTTSRLLLCHEDVQTGFVRTLSAANVTDIVLALTDAGAPNYMVLVFDSPRGMEPNKWLLFFNAASERDALLEKLMKTWHQHYQVALQVGQISDIALQKRCRDGLGKLKRKRVL